MIRCYLKLFIFLTFKHLILYTYPEMLSTKWLLTRGWEINLSPEDAGPGTLWHPWTNGPKSQLHTRSKTHTCLSLQRHATAVCPRHKENRDRLLSHMYGQSWWTSVVEDRPPRRAAWTKRPPHSLNRCLSNLACTAVSTWACQSLTGVGGMELQGMMLTQGQHCKNHGRKALLCGLLA